MNELWAIADGFLPVPKIGDLKSLAPAKRKPNRAPVETPRGIEVVTISGILTRDGSDLFSGTSYRSIADAVNRLAADSSVKQIVLRIDSPGGAVRGVHEAADAIFKHRHKIIAVADGLAASAAYWLGSQASMFYSTRGSLIGSIGTRMTMLDTSELMKRIGIRVISISTGDLKAVGEPGVPITSEQETYMRLLTQDVHSEFRDDVLRSRKLGTGQLKVAESAAVFVAAAAKNFGLIDGIQSFDDLLKSFGPIVSTADKYAARQNNHSGLAAAFSRK